MEFLGFFFSFWLENIKTLSKVFFYFVHISSPFCQLFNSIVEISVDFGGAALWNRYLNSIHHIIIAIVSKYDSN